jgi:hypothetical protein
MAMNMNPGTWEYVWLALPWKSGFLGFGGGWDPQQAAQIQEMGRSGFELVSVAPITHKDGPKSPQFILFFKRRTS